MSSMSYQENVIQQLITQESLLSKLYATFAEQFPEYKEFWTKLSEEEATHALQIKILNQAEKKGLVLFDESKTKTYILETFISRLEKIVDKAEKGEVDLSSAFAFALDVETALIEKNIFTHFDSLSDESRSLLEMLQSETLEHVGKVKQMQKQAAIKK